MNEVVYDKPVSSRKLYIIEYDLEGSYIASLAGSTLFPQVYSTTKSADDARSFRKEDAKELVAYFRSKNVFANMVELEIVTVARIYNE